ncbi:hypothetical protein ABIE44_002246 [Marmoricola sp. OAE513]|uniref:DUF1800 domain-containing protein n=1 Tax=Marmoricola sp. OAE513 TaxID=2817894 RepID=UPI001AE80D4D
MTVLQISPRTATKKKKKKKKAKKVAKTYPATKVLDARALLVVNRFTGGWTPGLGAEVTRSGGIDKWFAKQLSPASLPDTFYDSSATWWSSNLAPALTTIARHYAGTENVWEANAHYQAWSMIRRIGSERQVLETMANFWEHHFHVPTDGGQTGAYRQEYGRLIRRLALGKFDELLNAVSTDPAMGAFLGNATSTKSAPNENQGRELLELHTVGREAGYTEDDVKSSARILTGWRVDLWNTWVAAYNPAAHWTGPVKVLGFSHANTSSDGRAVTKAYLDYLARHPSTARRLARKLAVHFVSDAPSNGLVEHLASVYLANDTAIAPVLKALVASAEFKASAGKKTRTPEEDVIATYRALGVKITRPTTDEAAANAILWQANQIGMTPFGWPRPDGRPDVASAWTSVSRMLSSFEVHYTMSGGWWPDKGASYKKPSGWLPKASLRFDALVDHLSRSILGRPSTPFLLKVASQATGIPAAATITAKHDLVRWQMPRLLTVFLDNPLHIGR